ncbi:unnamed protein product [Adineta steineri]|uniref:Glycogen debranching enzyme C-terminal domain-containing protein n=1 Tax=Adineta steineri TaxID=433720 RepID=A0A820K4D5_9BILA|nr:unnamed protein product [Adineta steineri]
MGSNDKANNKGYLATRRDRSAINLIALFRAIISWIIQMNKQGYYPYNSIYTTSLNSEDKIRISFEKWLNQIYENFEKEFWIDQTNSSKYVNRKQIYKDTINSTWKWTNFQLQPNFLIAAVVAPEMFDKTHICDYVDDDDLNDYKRAHGYNYHNSPEWLWLTGYYIRAKLYWPE